MLNNIIHYPGEETKMYLISVHKEPKYFVNTSSILYSKVNEYCYPASEWVSRRRGDELIL